MDRGGHPAGVFALALMLAVAGSGCHCGGSPDRPEPSDTPERRPAPEAADLAADPRLPAPLRPFVTAGTLFVAFAPAAVTGDTAGEYLLLIQADTEPTGGERSFMLFVVGSDTAGLPVIRFRAAHASQEDPRLLKFRLPDRHRDAFVVTSRSGSGGFLGFAAYAEVSGVIREVAGTGGENSIYQGNVEEADGRLFVHRGGMIEVLEWDGQRYRPVPEPRRLPLVQTRYRESGARLLEYHLDLEGKVTGLRAETVTITVGQPLVLLNTTPPGSSVSARVLLSGNRNFDWEGPDRVVARAPGAAELMILPGGGWDAAVTIPLLAADTAARPVP